MRWWLVFLVACSGSKEASKGPVDDLRAKMCACKDRTCADAVATELKQLKVELTDEIAAQLAAAAECASRL